MDCVKTSTFHLPAQNDAAIAAGLIATRAAMTNEFRAGWSRDSLHLDRAQPQTGLLQTQDSGGGVDPLLKVTLPEALCHGYRSSAASSSSSRA